MIDGEVFRLREAFKVQKAKTKDTAWLCKNEQAYGGDNMAPHEDSLQAHSHEVIFSIKIVPKWIIT